MNDLHSDAVRKTLDVMERTHRSITLGGWVAVLATGGSFWWFSHVAKTSASTGKIVEAAVMALTCLIAWSTFGLAVLMVRMSRRLLRAIDLSVTSSQ